MPKTIERALITRDAHGVPFVIATDGAAFAFFMREVSTQVDDFITMEIPDGPGIYLFTGTIESEAYSYEHPDERETVARGETRAVQPGELEELLKMEPPVEDEPEDRS